MFDRLVLSRARFVGDTGIFYRGYTLTLNELLPDYEEIKVYLKARSAATDLRNICKIFSVCHLTKV